MKNPIDANLFKFYLEFKSLGKTELYRICEPIGFDGAKLVKEQEAKRHARSREYFALDGLEFKANYFSGITEVEQIINPQGETSFDLDLGFEWLLETLNKNGINSKVYFHFSVNDVMFPTIFQLDFSEKSFTDWETFIKCKLIQNDRVFEIKRKQDDKVNIFATQNYKGEEITPVETIKVLRKGLIETKKGEVVLSDEKFIYTKAEGLGTKTEECWFNPAIEIKKDDLKHIITHIEDSQLENPSNSVEDLFYYYAQKETYNLKLTISNLSWNKYVAEASNGYLDFKFHISSGYSASNPEFYFNELLYETLDNQGQETTFTLNQTFTIPFIPVGGKIFIYFYVKTRKSNSGLGSVRSSMKILPFQISFLADVKSLNLVVPMIRYIDYIKQAVKCVNELPVNGTEFELKGKFDDLVIWGKRMITGKKDQLFTTPKEALESIVFLNCDYEIDNTGIQILEGDKFYEDKEISVFKVSPKYTILSEFNPKASLKKIEYNITTFSNDRDVKDSDKVVHATSEWNVPNEGAKEDLIAKVDLILDPIYKQDAIDLETKKPTTLTEREDKIFLDDIVLLPPNTKNTIALRLLCQASSTTRKILNYSLESTEENDLGIDWNTWGFVQGQTISINGETMIFNDVIENEAGNGYMLVLTASTSLEFQGDLTLSIEYYYQELQYQTRTTEGFSLINGATSQFGMLAYTPRRNLKHFEKFLAMSMIHNDIIKNVEYKNNGTLETRLDTETVSVIENASFLKENMPNPYTNDKVFKITCVPDYEEVIQYYENYKNTKGYVRFDFPNGSIKRGFIKNMEYLPKSGECDIEFEEKYYTENLAITVIPLDKKTIIEGVDVYWWEFANDKFKAYDEKSRPLCNWIDFNLLILNGISYATKQEVITALTY